MNINEITFCEAKRAASTADPTAKQHSRPKLLALTDALSSFFFGVRSGLLLFVGLKS